MNVEMLRNGWLKSSRIILMMIRLDKLNSVMMGGLTMLYVAASYDKKELAYLLLQNGAAVDVNESHGGTPILSPLYQSGGLANEIVTMLYEWGASLEHRMQGEQKALVDKIRATTPMFKNEIIKRRCEITNLDQRKDLNGQTCIVAKYIAKKNRYKVTMEHAHETFLVGPNNLKRRDRTPNDPGYYITFEDGEYKRLTFASNE